jgi:hypothetical protein
VIYTISLLVALVAASGAAVVARVAWRAVDPPPPPGPHWPAVTHIGRHRQEEP